MEMQEIQSRIDDYVYQNIDSFIDSLALLCAEPSISTQDSGMLPCADLVMKMLSEDGYQAEILPAAGQPVIFGEENRKADKTLLFYLHYDVQPPEPLELWNSPPFELTRKGNKLIARGAADDKGHIIARLAGLSAVRYAMGHLPCNVKFIIEGEEEIGSPNLPAFVDTYQSRLAADACIWEYGGVNYDGAPHQVLGLRGICYVELSTRTANIDAHSGLAGSIFPNAAWRLTWALNSLKDQHERILIPGFYDDVLPASERDVELLARLPENASQMQEMYGLKQFLNGMTGGVELRRAAVFEPTCTICGLDSGYQGPGSKTVLPAEASAKVDFRLVPDQSPDDIVAKLRKHLDEQGFDDIQIRYHGGTWPAKTDPDHPFVKVANKAAQEVYGQEAIVSPMGGGSGPSYLFDNHLGLPIISSGVVYPGSSAHAPNEHIRIEDLLNGIRHTAYITAAFAQS